MNIAVWNCFWPKVFSCPSACFGCVFVVAVGSVLILCVQPGLVKCLFGLVRVLGRDVGI